MKRLIKKAEKILIKDILNPLDKIKNMVYDINITANRDKAIVIYNGEVFEAHIHEEALRNATQKHGSKSSMPLAFGCILSDIYSQEYIVLFPDMLENMKSNEAIDILKNNYPNAIICTDPCNNLGDADAYIETV